jgi:hypothetical protein
MHLITAGRRGLASKPCDDEVPRGEEPIGPSLESLLLRRGRLPTRTTEARRARPDRAPHGASRRRGTGSARAGSGGRGEGAGRSARRAPGGAPISPTRHAPRNPAAPRNCGEASPPFRVASGALSDSRGYRTRVVDVPLHFVTRGHPGPLRVALRATFNKTASTMFSRRGRKERAPRGLPTPGNAARARTCGVPCGPRRLRSRARSGALRSSGTPSAGATVAPGTTAAFGRGI